jgi:hypothetical protein
MPKNVPSGVKIPVVLWGNSGCGGNGVAWMSPLVEWASQGIMVIADGNPGGSGKDTAALLKKGLDWAVNNAGKGKYSMVDASRIGVAGQSCGYVMKLNPEIEMLTMIVAYWHTKLHLIQESQRLESSIQGP